MKVITTAPAGKAVAVAGGTRASMPSPAAGPREGASVAFTYHSGRADPRPEPATPGEIMASRLNPFLTFNGDARQAMEFYASVFGGTPAFNTFAEFGAGDSPDADRISFGLLETGAGYTMMAGDVASDAEYRPMAGFSVSLSGDDADLLRGYWDKLSAGGTTTMPLAKQAWGDEFGMCTDKFGVSWMVNISQPQA
jgi:PhnB protein